MRRKRGGRRATFALALVAAGCAHRQDVQPAPEPTPVAPAPSPTPTPTPTPTINSDLGPEESLWHLRAALNVAALMCGGQPGGVELVGHYNALLTNDKAVLAQAYAAEAQRFGPAPGDLDHHSTALYNFFARPNSTALFCAAASDVATEVSGTAADQLTTIAPAALARLQEAVLAPAPPRPAIATRQLAVAAPGNWRIQLGAFTGQSAAEAAWARISAKVPSLSAFQPIYLPVPNSALVRVRLDSGSDRDGALKLCAAAAAGGFDCLPLAQH